MIIIIMIRRFGKQKIVPLKRKTRNVCWVKTLGNSQKNASVGVSRPAVLLKKHVSLEK